MKVIKKIHPHNLLKLSDSHLTLALFDVLNLNYTIIDPEGNYVCQNASTVNHISQGLLKAQEIDETTWNDCKRVMESKTKSVKEELFRNRYYLSIKQPLIENDNCVGIMVVSIDITDQKLAEEREKLAIAQATEAKIKAKAETELRQAVMILAGSIAHDLRTPLSIIQLNSRIIEKKLGELEETYQKTDALPIEKIHAAKWNAMKDAVPDILDATQTMNQFITTTLKTLSQVLKGELTEKDLKTCSLWHCVHNILTRYPFAPGQRDLITWQQGDFEFLGDELLMFRILSNLLKNSLEQIQKNKRGAIFITAEQKDKVNVLRFKDTAGGAPPEVVAQLFDGYLTTKEKGTGVGLAFCKLTMKSFGGDITCHSIYGDSIEFVLTFPRL